MKIRLNFLLLHYVNLRKDQLLSKTKKGEANLNSKKSSITYDNRKYF